MRLPGLDDIEQQCWRQVLGSSIGLLAALNGRLMDSDDLSLVDVLLLDLLATSERGAARISALADALMLASSRVGQRVARLEARSLVARRRTRYDRRGVLVSITGDGWMRLDAAARTYAEVFRTHCLDQMSGPQLIALGESCGRINTSLKNGERLSPFKYFEVPVLVDAVEAGRR